MGYFHFENCTALTKCYFVVWEIYYAALAQPTQRNLGLHIPQ